MQISPTASILSTVVLPATQVLAPTRTPTQPPFPWERYLPRTLEEIDQLTAADLATMENGDLYIEMSPTYQYRSRVEVTYTGEVRTTPDGLQMIASVFLTNFGPQLDQAQRENLFGQEMLFSEGSAEYWLAVQAPLLTELQEELEADDSVTLYLLFAGASMQGAHLERLYLVNAFE
jgi:hypothetical protein